MRVKPENSHAPIQVQALVQALANYAGEESRFRELALRLWPEGDIYRGGTHLRVMTEPGEKWRGSVYLEL